MNSLLFLLQLVTSSVNEDLKVFFYTLLYLFKELELV
jgi:hypothetical protein